MASGWAGDNAVNEQINDSINDEIARARSRLPKGASLLLCEECGDEIPNERRKALQGVRLCIECQQDLDTEYEIFSGYNRKGSKDSQLK